MNSSRGKASTQASRRPGASSRQPNVRKNVRFSSNNGNVSRPRPQRPRPRRPRNISRDLFNSRGSTGPLGLSSSNSSSSGRTKFHIIDEDEYIADINGSVAFATTQYSGNIGQSGSFPWGYKIASLYEKYRFLKLEFYYRREVSEYATNGQAGKVMLSWDYDASDGAPTSKQQVLDTEPHADGMPSTEKISLVVNCQHFQKTDGMYVRPGAQPANTDIKTYDCGNLFVSTYGNTNTTVVGELRVRYTCRVEIPVLESGQPQTGSAGSYLQITSNLLGETTAATTVYQAMFIAASGAPVTIANGIGATLSTAGLITLLPGTYLIESSSVCTNSAAAVSAGTMKLCQVATANTSVVWNNGGTGSQSLVTATGGYDGWQNADPPFIWNTAQWGLTFAVQQAWTYASGTSTTQGYLKVTQL